MFGEQTPNGWQNIDGQRLKQLRDALMDAFPTRDDLEMMLSDQNMRLTTITGGGAYEHTVFALIRSSIAAGGLQQLVIAAHKQNPQNPKLRSVAEQLGVLSSVTPLGQGAFAVIAEDINLTRNASSFLEKEEEIRLLVKGWLPIISIFVLITVIFFVIILANALILNSIMWCYADSIKENFFVTKCFEGLRSLFGLGTTIAYILYLIHSLFKYARRKFS